jgi:Ser-Thr-rich glycosyl-phosphatidyl-inositol-anchored membrane family
VEVNSSPLYTTFPHLPETDLNPHVDRVTLLLLRGPSTNVVPILTIAENIPNTGSYVWPSVPTTLEADVTGYGIQLIVEGTGAYQYSPQCGVKNDAYMRSSSASSSAATTVTVISATTSSRASSTSSMALTSSSSIYSPVPSAAGTGGNFSVPVVSPSRTMSVPSTLQSTFANTVTRSASSTVAAPSATFTGGAAQLMANAGVLMVAGAVAVFAF